ncbi:MAG: cation-translocating P-type ATPase [Minisyncoccia bacterium]
MNTLEYAPKSIKEIFQILNSKETGLDYSEINLLKQKFGLNEIKAKELRLIDVLIRQFKSAFVYLLLIASLIAFFLNQRIEAVLIIIFVSINVFFGFFEEYRAEKSIKVLKDFLKTTTKVIRNNKLETIESKFLVPGDLVILEAGDIVPADIRLIETNNFLVDESVFTGESQPILKTSETILKAKTMFEAKNIIFSKTSVVLGEAKGIVVNTGLNTEFGKLAKTSASIIKPSLYEKELTNFSKIILRIVLITFFIIFLLNLILKKHSDISYYIIFCLALIVGIIPEALPVVVTASLSKGALKLLRKKVVVKRLSAIQDLGNMEVLCTDKTGTLTKNKLEIDKVFSKDKNLCLFYALLVSPIFKNKKLTNPIDLAILKALKENYSIKDYTVLKEEPFNFEKMRTEILIKTPEDKKIIIIRGISESVLEDCLVSKNDLNKEDILKEIKEIEKEGKRIISVAYKEIKNKKTDIDLLKEKDFTFLGYISFIDPLKETAHSAIELAKKLNVKVKIITGDSKEVSGKVAFDIGLINDPKEVVSLNELINLSEEEFFQKCDRYSVFSRVTPEMKFKIIKALQKKYEVGFLGEGVNDILALKTANVGIAVKEAVDVSKQTADIFLLESDLKVIIEGIKEGRIIFSNINKYLKCAVSSNFGNFYSIAIMSLILPFLPMLPQQILLENILSDTPLISVSGDTVDIEELEKPKIYTISKVFPYILILALLSSLFDLIFLSIFYKKPPETIRTLWFIFSLLTEMAFIYSIRTKNLFYKAAKPSKILTTSLISVILFSLILPYFPFGKKLFSFSPPNFSFLVLVFVLVLIYFLSNELIKRFYFKFYFSSK